MFDSFVPSSGNTWDKSFNSSFTSECGNAEPADAITPGLAINNIPASGATGEVIDIPPPTLRSALGESPDVRQRGCSPFSLADLSEWEE